MTVLRLSMYCSLAEARGRCVMPLIILGLCALAGALFILNLARILLLVSCGDTTIEGRIIQRQGRSDLAKMWQRKHDSPTDGLTGIQVSGSVTFHSRAKAQ
ncbi:hypothetical protein K474DRAFT_655032 [Panus rudis PR-1116 ss-1]|nr:hypothetical protein K474DRAFT_655032 [Panus rudis PR-1116 ss-1]